MHEIEHRAVELRADSEGVLSGVLIPYGVPSTIGGKFTEIWTAGRSLAAFQRSGQTSCTTARGR